MPARLECRAVAAGHRERHVFKLDDATSAIRRHAVADAESPRAPFRVTAEGAKFAQVDDRALEAFVAQKVSDGVGDIALGDAVERDRHAGTRKADSGRAAVDLAEIHQCARKVVRACRDVRLESVRDQKCASYSLHNG